MQTPVLIIVNHHAARAHRAWQLVREAFERRQIRYDANWMGTGIENAASPHATASRVREGIQAGHQTIVVIGGDGTLSAAVSGFFESTAERVKPPPSISQSASLAIVPAGTGDDFARGLTNGQRQPVDGWIDRLVRHLISNEVDNQSGVLSADLIWASIENGDHRFICLNASTIGVGADVTGGVALQGPALRHLPGEVRFALAAIKPIAHWRNRSLRVRLDEDEWEECSSNMIAVCNGAFAGGGMNFAPGAEPTDGLLDIVTASALSRGGVVREMLRIHRGGHVANQRVRLQRARRVVVESLEDELAIEADGDPRGRTPAEYRIMPGAIRIVW